MNTGSMVSNTEDKESKDIKEEAATEESHDASHKKRNYKKELEELQNEYLAIKDHLLRLAAEFDNYRKRSEREMSGLIRSAKADLIARLLPVLDDLDRSIVTAAGNEQPSPLLEGIKLIQKSFIKTLQEQGLKQIDSVGQPFDPEKHEALMVIGVDGKEPNLVVEEHVKGYEFNDRVIRHAKVVVSK